MLDSEGWWIESGSLDNSGVTILQTKFPYFDNYNVVSGSFPTQASLSLLFNNEAASYGAIPSGSLYTNYWEKYITLLYNPKTRLLNCSAIIPLADYVKMELNDIVNFRGNYYHLRAINDYSLKDGTCNLQLLGPIISDTFFQATQNTPIVTTCCTPVLNSVVESGSNISLNFTLGGGETCIDCVATTIQSSTDGVSWGSSNTAGCTSPRTLTAPSVPTYYRVITNCDGGTTSTPSNPILFTPDPVLNWYLIEDCLTGGTVTTTSYIQNTFVINERVRNGGRDYIVTNVYTSNPGGSAVAITSTGQFGCPSLVCRDYSYFAMAGCTIFWQDCNGNQQSAFVPVGQTYNISCAREGNFSGCGPFTGGAFC
jgi:hypothetical protein